MGPLGMSAKQHREYLKLQSQEQREAAKMEREESRKNQLHEIKLKEAAAKANQGIGHKEDLHAVKLKELGSPLGKPQKVNKQKLGIPTQNPMAGTGMFKQGQHKLYAQGTEGVSSTTDTVPAMLTPGEAVIPEPAAQDPKNKKAIQRMVQEGREKNKLRDGTVSIVNSDVPSLAYRHPDEPGSSFENGSMGVPEFSRGSSAQANYNDGTYGVVPQQVQSAAGYNLGTTDASIEDAMYGGNFSLGEPIQQDISQSLEVPAAINDYAIVPGEPTQLAEAPLSARDEAWLKQYNTAQKYQADVEAAKSAIKPQAYVGTRATPEQREAAVKQNAERELALQNFEKAKQERLKVGPMVTPNMNPSNPVAVVEVPKPADVAASSKPVVAPGTSQSTKVVVPVPNKAQSTSTSIGQIPYATAEDNAALDVPKVMADPNAVDVTEKEGSLAKPFDYTNPQAASTALQSKQDAIKGYMKMQGYDVDAPKDDKGFLESFKNSLSYSGAKDALGLNNQEVARMAVMALGGRMRGYDFGRSLAYAGRNMFMEASKRSAQESTDKAAAMRNAVTMEREDTRSKQADNRAAAKETHDRFVAEQQVRMAQIKDEYNRHHGYDCTRL